MIFTIKQISNPVRKFVFFPVKLETNSNETNKYAWLQFVIQYKKYWRAGTRNFYYNPKDFNEIHSGKEYE